MSRLGPREPFPLPLNFSSDLFTVCLICAKQIMEITESTVSVFGKHNRTDKWPVLCIELKIHRNLELLKNY